MTFFNRPNKKFKNGMLYARINGKKISTKLEDTLQNRKMFEKCYSNNDFLEKFGIVAKVSPTVISLCEDVLKEKESILKPSSISAYLSLFESKIVPYFDNKKVTDIKPLDIDKFYKTFTDKSSLNTCNAILKKAFESAILQEHIIYTPLSISKPIIKSKYVSDPFEMEEVLLLLSEAKGEFLNMLGILLATGLRAGELISLKWQDIDFVNDTINIERTMYKGRMQTPKTIGSCAVIDLPFEAKKYILEQRKITGLREYIFYTRFNKPFTNHNSLNDKLYHYCNRLKLRVRSIHQTRHTFASLKLSYGEKLEWVSFMLRHDNPSFTQKVYYKYIPRKKEERVVFDFDIVPKKAQNF